MGAALLVGYCGIENRTINNSAAYLANWLNALKNDYRMVHVAASQAQEAVGLVLTCTANIDLDGLNRRQPSSVALQSLAQEQGRLYERCFSGSPAFQLLAGTILSLVMSFGSVFFGIARMHRSDIASLVLTLLLFVLSYIIPTGMLALILYRSFQAKQSHGTKLRIIALSYLSMIAVFTGVYFSMAAIGDRGYAVDHYFYYASAGEDLAIGRIKHLNPLPVGTRRAFSGIQDRLRTTVDDYIPVGIYRDLDDVERKRATVAASLPFDTAVRFRRLSVRSVISDCLHLSVMTVATVGYRNVAPMTWCAKRASELGALTGTVLLVFALGMLFSQFDTIAKEAN